MAAADIDDAKPRVGEAHRTVGVDSGPIGAPVRDLSDHVVEQPGLHRPSSKIDDAYDSTHRRPADASVLK
jgi:hypothetical protein